MKRFEEIVKEIAKKYAIINKLIDEKNTYTENLGSNPHERFVVAKNDKKIDEYKKKIESLRETIDTENLSLKVLENNAVVALFTESIPVIVEVLNTYKGKKVEVLDIYKGRIIGEKWYKEIKDKIKAQANINVFLYNSFIEIYPISNVFFTHFEIYHKGTLCSGDGKLLEVKAEDFQISSNYRYIDDISDYLNDLKTMKKQIILEMEKLDTKIGEYNKKIVSGFVGFDFIMPF